MPPSPASPAPAPPPRVAPVAVHRVVGTAVSGPEEDLLAVEAPLELRVEGRPFLVTMRTPGDDRELAAGILFAEGVIDGPDDLRALAHVDDPRGPRGNRIDALLASGVALPDARHAREGHASSACGVCGSASIDHVLRRLPVRAAPARPLPAADLLHALPGRLRAVQSTFERTGGLHAAALFDWEGRLLLHREDIGRHNAVDKVVGARLLADRVPIEDGLLLTSGRLGFEIVQKAVIAGISVVCAVGAPSSLAATLAWRAGLRLVGFLRDGRYNVYGGPPAGAGP